jgi:hypothetical protein
LTTFSTTGEAETAAWAGAPTNEVARAATSVETLRDPRTER